MKTTKYALAVALGLIVLVVPRAARADNITYTQTVTASGTLDGTNFNNALVTLSLTGDTSNISEFPSGTSEYFQLVAPTTVSVVGVGSDTFTDPIAVFDNELTGSPLLPWAGFDIDITTTKSGEIPGLLVLSTSDPAFATYSLSAPIGPITNTADFNGADSFNTAGGSFDITSVSGDSTFTATAPEPSSLLLLGTGLVGLVSAMRRKRLA